MKSDGPPMLARRLLGAALPPRPGLREMLPDLDEEFRQLVAAAPLRRARRWYWSQALRSIRSLAALRFEGVDGRRQLLACLTLLALFVFGNAFVDLLFEWAGGTVAFRLTVDAAVLALSTALAARVAQRSGTRDPLPARVSIGTFALGLGVFVLSGCAEHPPAFAWVAWMVVSATGVGIGSTVESGRA